MNPDVIHGAGSIVAVGLAGVGLEAGLGPDTCVPVGAVVLLAIASPRDIWQIARKVSGVDED